LWHEGAKKNTWITHKEFIRHNNSKMEKNNAI